MPRSEGEGGGWQGNDGAARIPAEGRGAARTIQGPNLDPRTPYQATTFLGPDLTCSSQQPHLTATSHPPRHPPKRARAHKAHQKLNPWPSPPPPPQATTFPESNLMHGINGYIFCNGPTLQLAPGERLRLVVMGFGSEVDMHSPVFSGQTVLSQGAPRGGLTITPKPKPRV